MTCEKRYVVLQNDTENTMTQHVSNEGVLTTVQTNRTLVPRISKGQLRFLGHKIR